MVQLSPRSPPSRPGDSKVLPSFVFASLVRVWSARGPRTGEKRRTPTVRQFSKMARDAANSWFGGDLERVYAVIGEKSPVDPIYERLMPANAAGLAQSVFDALGGRPLERFIAQNPDEVTAEQATTASVYQAADAARGAIRFIQCREAKGEAPTIPEFGTGKWKRFSDLFGQDDDAWDRFIQVVEDALTIPPAPESALPATPPASQATRTAAAAGHMPTPSVSPQLRKHRTKSKKGLLDRLLGR